jgi:hypothetical protein
MDDITFYTISSNIVLDYDDMLNNFFKPFKRGIIQINYYFMVHSENATTTVMKTIIDADSQETFDFAKKNNLNNNNQKIMIK